MQSTRALAFAFNIVRHYAPKYPRPRPGTSERPPYRAPDPLLNNPKAVVTKLEDENLTFIHRPPPSVPSPISYTTAPLSPLLRPPTIPTGAPLPPLSRSSPQPVRHRMSDGKLQEMIKLRRSDPKTYTRGKLAKIFMCKQVFVGLVAPLKKPMRKKLNKDRDAEHALNRTRWSERHQLVKAIAKKRRELW